MAIHGFEKHAGPEISEEYQKFMEEYRQKAIRICITIDNFKKKYIASAIRYVLYIKRKVQIE
jgi:hypothetical protein